MECYRGGSRWNVVGEGPDGVRFEEPMELLTRKEGGGGECPCVVGLEPEIARIM